MLTISVSLHLAGSTLEHDLSSCLDLFPKDQTTTKGPGNQQVTLFSTRFILTLGIWAPCFTYTIVSYLHSSGSFFVLGMKFVNLNRVLL